MASLVVEDLKVSYGHVQAIDGVNLELNAGTVLGVIGANGAGKSTLLKAICGLVPAESGRVVLNGVDVTHRSARDRVRAGLAMSPEGRGTLPGMSVKDNLLLGGYTSRSSLRRLTTRLDEVLPLFPVLSERLGQSAETLSGGEAAMLSIARALMSQPQLLLLDEPTLGLAPRVTETLFERIAALRDTGMTMLIVEQRATQLLDVADAVLQMKRGRSTGITNAQSLSGEELSNLYFGSASHDEAGAVAS